LSTIKAVGKLTVSIAQPFYSYIVGTFLVPAVSAHFTHNDLNLEQWAQSNAPWGPNHYWYQQITDCLHLYTNGD